LRMYLPIIIISLLFCLPGCMQRKYFVVETKIKTRNMVTNKKIALIGFNVYKSFQRTKRIGGFYSPRDFIPEIDIKNSNKYILAGVARPVSAFSFA